MNEKMDKKELNRMREQLGIPVVVEYDKIKLINPLTVIFFIIAVVSTGQIWEVTLCFLLLWGITGVYNKAKKKIAYNKATKVKK